MFRRPRCCPLCMNVGFLLSCSVVQSADPRSIDHIDDAEEEEEDDDDEEDDEEADGGDFKYSAYDAYPV